MRKRRRRKRKWIFLFLFLLVLAAGTALFVWREKRQEWLQKAEEYRRLGQTEKEWILNQQTEDGLILYVQWDMEKEEEEQTVVPYFSSIAAWSLLQGSVTEEQAQGAYRYLTWYLDHLNTAEEDPVNGDGTIYDYRVLRQGEQLTEVSTGEYDSVDSYGALFLIGANQYTEKVGLRLLEERKEDIFRVLDALLRTLGENGLSYTKAEYPVQYLMDNAEVYAGLLAGQKLLEKTEPEGERAEKVRQAITNMEYAFEHLLWNEEKEVYEIGLMNDGTPLGSHPWESFYPDSAGQLFPACFGLLDTGESRWQNLYERFCEEWDWERLEHQQSRETTFYWCVTAYAAALEKDEERLLTFMETYQDVLEKEGRVYPLYTGDSGWVALACGYMEEYYREKFW